MNRYFLDDRKHILANRYIPVAKIFGLLLSCQWRAESLRIPRTLGINHSITAEKEKKQYNIWNSIGFGNTQNKNS